MMRAFVIALSVVSCVYCAVHLPNEQVADFVKDWRSTVVHVKSEASDIVENHIETSNLGSPSTKNFIEDAIKDYLESFRDTVINGNDNLPPLDPFGVDQVGPFNANLNGVVVRASVKNFAAEGLRWYVVDRVTFSPLRLTFGLQLTLPWLNAVGRYDAEARLAFLVLHRAGGNFRVFVNRVVVRVDARLGTNILGGGHLTLRSLEIDIDVYDTFVQITGMTGSSLLNGIISSFVQDLTQSAIQNEMANVSQLLSDQLFDVINELLKNFRLEDLLG